ncbi:hypothetical protein RZP32_22800, partial [Enterobacter asburiae]|nr:hypothetical protein [Enterobacter asburiae]
KIGPDPRNFNQRVSLGRNDLLIRTFLKNETEIAEYKNELAAYQTILQTLKRMAKRHLKQ